MHQGGYSRLFFKLFKEMESSRQGAREETVQVPSSESIMEILPDGYYRVDLKGNFTYVNTALCALRDGRAENFLGINFRRFATIRSARKTIEICYGVYCTGTPSKIIDFEMLDGRRQVRYLEVSVGLLHDEDGQPVGFHGIARDRTQERENHFGLDRYCNFVESIEDGCFEVDLDGTIIFVNNGMCRIHGYSPQEMLGMNHRSFASPEDAKSVYTVFNRIFSTGVPCRIFDYAIIHKDGTSRHVELSATLIRDDKGNIVGFRGITRDRTEKRMQELLHERYRKFLENVEDSCCETDLKGKITFCNEATAKIFGYPPEQLVGLSYKAYTTPETAERIYSFFNQVYQSGRSAKVKHYEIIRPDGARRYLDMTVSLIKDNKGDAIGFRGIGRDVTRQHNMEMDKARLSEMVNQIQRLEAVSTLAAGVAHNFNNLLMGIQGYVSLVEMDINAGDENLKRLKIVQEKIHKGAELTAQLLTYANIDKQQVAFGDINQIVRDVTARFKMDATKKAQVNTFMGHDLPPVALDRFQMEHVLTNLLNNAEQAMPDGGVAELKTEKMTLTEDFTRPHGREPGPYLIITVTDSGKGMDEETRKRIFEPFYTTKKDGLGTGLGLAAVYGIVKSHNGIIEIDSGPGEGTTFTVYLPITSPNQQDLNPQAAPILADKITSTILLADDERITLELMHKWLEKMGYKVITATTGEEALELFVARQEEIDLVIMDVVMPGISGDEALARMGTIDPDVKGILVSGFIDSDQEEGIIRNGRQALFQKPIDYDTFQDAIARLLAAA